MVFNVKQVVTPGIMADDAFMKQLKLFGDQRKAEMQTAPMPNSAVDYARNVQETWFNKLNKPIHTGYTPEGRIGGEPAAAPPAAPTPPQTMAQRAAVDGERADDMISAWDTVGPYLAPGSYFGGKLLGALGTLSPEESKEQTALSLDELRAQEQAQIASMNDLSEALRRAEQMKMNGITAPVAEEDQLTDTARDLGFVDDQAPAQQEGLDRNKLSALSGALDETRQQIKERTATPLKQDWWLNAMQVGARSAAETGLSGVKYPLIVFENARNAITGNAERTDVRAYADATSAMLEKLLPGDKARSKDFLTKLSAGGGSYAAFLLAGIVSGTIGAAYLGSAAQATSMYEDAERLNATAFQKFMALTTGTGMGALEALPIARALEGAERVHGPIVRRMLANASGSSAHEALQEISQAVGEDILAKYAIGYDPNREISVKDWLEAGAVGGITGAFGGAAAAATTKAPAGGEAEADPNAQRDQAIRQAIEDKQAEVDAALGGDPVPDIAADTVPVTSTAVTDTAAAKDAATDAATAAEVYRGGTMPAAREDGMIELTHWSHLPLDEINPALRGTGPLRGAERARLYGPDAVDRSYYGVGDPDAYTREQAERSSARAKMTPKEKAAATRAETAQYERVRKGLEPSPTRTAPYRPEGGLGQFRHTVAVKPEELYNAVEDPEGIWNKVDRTLAKSEQTTQYERLIKDAGFKGVYYPESTLGQTAILFDSRKPERMVDEMGKVPVTPSNFKQPTPRLFHRPGWAILTSTQEALGDANAPANVAALEQLRGELKGKGAIEIGGVYQGVDQGSSFIVFGSEQEALEMGRRYGQESILTNRGLVYPDGRLVPAVPGSTVVGDKAKEGDFYSVLPDGTAFSMGLDFDAETRTDAEPMDAMLSAEMLDRLPGMHSILPYVSEAEANRITDRTAKTVLDIFTSLPSATEMAAVAYSGRAKRGWYARSARALVDIFGATDAPRFAALLAALSPQTSVESNALNTINVWTAWVKAGRPVEPARIRTIMQLNVQGGGGKDSVLPAWVSNSIEALTNPDPAKIELSGPKVMAFMENLRGNVNEVTNDAWMANYANMDQAVFAGRAVKVGDRSVRKAGPGYIAMAAAVRRAADIATEMTGETWTPAEVQETVWSWAKTLYEKSTETGSTAEELIAAANMTADEIANTPDFAQLFTNNVFKEILERGGYNVEDFANGSESTGRDTARGSHPASAEGSAFDDRAYKAHLAAAARRLDELRARREAAEDPNDLEAIFAGSSAQTLDNDMFRRAMDMADENIHPEDIWNLTGFYRGTDGKWRFEIADRDAALTDKAKRYFEEGDAAGMRADEVLQHDKLFEAYPDLRGINVVFQKGEEGGVYDHNNRTIRATGPTEADAVSVILHEMQHAVQEIENTARGGNLTMGRIYEGTNVENWRKALATAEDAYASGKISLEALEQYRAGFDRAAAYEYYRRLAGEVEARNVQSRYEDSQRLLADAKRGQRIEPRLRDLYPGLTADTDRDDQIVITRSRDGMGAQMAQMAKGPRAPVLYPAIRHNGKVYKSVADHLSALSQIPDVEERAAARADGDNRGFVDARGRFLNRFRAQEYALENDLIKPDAPAWARTAPDLISENLRRDFDAMAAQMAQMAQGPRLANIDTPEFKAWFGDSVVVDESGGPLEVYHGTSADFTAFDPSKRGKTDEGWLGSGFYFTTDRSVAESYGKRTIPAYLHATRLFDFTGQNFKRVVDSHGGPDGFADWLRSEGYDGAKLWSQIMVLDPTQIKSVDNRGAFNPNDPDIYAMAAPKGTAQNRNAYKGEQTRPAAGIPVTPGATPSEISLTQIANNVVKALDLTARQGRLSIRGAEVMGQYSRKQAVVRLRTWGDLSTLVHEGGHALHDASAGALKAFETKHAATLRKAADDLYADTTKLSQEQMVREGFAEFFRVYTLSRPYALKHYPDMVDDFSKLMEADAPQTKKALDAIGDQFAAWLQLPSDRLIAGMVVDAAKPGRMAEAVRELKEAGFPTWLHEKARDATTAVVNGLAPLNDVVRDLLVLGHENKGSAIDLKRADDPRVLAQLSRNTGARAMVQLTDGVMPYRSTKPASRGLREAILLSQGLRADQSPRSFNDARLKDFDAYLIALRASDEYGRYQKGIIKRPPINASIGDITQAIADFEGKYGQSFREAAEIVHEFGMALWKKQYDAGLMDKETYTDGLTRNFYAPLQRDMSDKKSEIGQSVVTGGQSIVKNFKGSDRQIVSPTAVLMHKAFALEQTIAANDVKKALAVLADRVGTAGALVERVPATTLMSKTYSVKEVAAQLTNDEDISATEAADLMSILQASMENDNVLSFFRPEQARAKGENIVFFWENGKIAAVQVKDGDVGVDLVNLMNGVGRENFQIGVELIAGVSTAVRSAITLWPDFLLVNYVRDQFSAWILNDVGFKPFWSGARGMIDEVRQNEWARSYNASLGIMGGMNVAALHDARVRRDIGALRGKGYITKAFGEKGFTGAAKGFANLVELSETGTRIGIFRGAYDRAKADGLNDWEAAIEAAYTATDYMDYGMHGNRMLLARRTIPFLNAQLQGLSKMVRTLGANEARQRVGLRTVLGAYLKSTQGIKKMDLSRTEQQSIITGRKAWVKMVSLGLLSAALAFAFEDDPDYQETSEYIRTTHWVIPMGDGEIITIPKPFELAIIANAVERGFEAAAGDPEAKWRFMRGLAFNLSPPTTPPAIGTMVELAANYDFFSEREIVPDYMRALEPELQYNNYTTELAKWLGGTLGWSPMKIDHFLSSIGASAYRDISTMVNQTNPNRPSLDSTDMPILRRFVRDARRGSVSGKDFWKQASTQTGTLRGAEVSYKTMLEGGNETGANRFLETLEPDAKAYALLGAHHKVDAKRLNPVYRARQIATVISAMRREIGSDLGLGDTTRKGSTDTIRLTSGTKAKVDEVLSEYVRREVRNTLIATGTSGWGGKRQIGVEPTMRLLERANPEVADELRRRLKKAKVYDGQAVFDAWPEARDRLLQDREAATFNDLIAIAKVANP